MDLVPPLRPPDIRPRLMLRPSSFLEQQPNIKGEYIEDCDGMKLEINDHERGRRDLEIGDYMERQAQLRASDHERGRKEQEISDHLGRQKQLQARELFFNHFPLISVQPPSPIGLPSLMPASQPLRLPGRLYPPHHVRILLLLL